MTTETNQPAEANAQSELKQVLGALLFASRKPITVDELRAVLAQVDQNGEDAAHPFGKIRDKDIRTALEQIQTEIAERKLGIIVVEVAGGFRFQTDPSGGPWVRHLLNLDKPARLSKPALETLAIIAYRQPATRAEIEALRGVNVDAMMRHLLELQLIRIMGRSDLPGRPLMYGTTQLFLEHFGLSSVKNLPGVEQLSRRDAERVRRETDTGLPTVAPNEVEGAKAGRQTTDTGPEKTKDGGQKTDDVSEDERETAEEEGQTPRDAGQPARSATPSVAGEATDPAKRGASLSRAARDNGHRPSEGGQSKASDDDEEEIEEDGEEDEDDEDDEDEDEGRK